MISAVIIAAFPALELLSLLALALLKSRTLLDAIQKQYNLTDGFEWFEYACRCHCND
jgi:hypothetical protein